MVEPHSKGQDADSLVKSMSFKAFSRYTTTERGRKIVKEHNVVSYTTNEEAMKEANRRLRMMIREDMQIDKMVCSNTIGAVKFSIPSSVIASLARRIAELEEILKSSLKSDPNDSGFYMTAISALTEVKELLSMGTHDGFTRAVIKMYSCRSTIYMEIPADVVRFLHTGGVLKLQHYMDILKPVNVS